MLNSCSVHAASTVPVRVVLGVCTYKRPGMLADCLASLTGLITPLDCELIIVVVDNEVSEETRKLVEAFAERSGHEMTYRTEACRGIPQARNAVLAAAIELDADKIVMLDDDQMVPIHWLQDLWMIQAQTNADAIKSSVNFDYPSPLPRWAFPRKTPHRTNFNAPWLATCGVMFDAHLVRDDGLRLRFDERYAVSGGEDRDFFLRAREKGAHLVKTAAATATEFVPETKCAYSAQLRRKYFETLVGCEQDLRVYGSVYAMFANIYRCLSCFLRGLIPLPFGLAVLIGNAYTGRRMLLNASKRLAEAAGIAVGLTGLQSSRLYAETHGR